MNWTPRKNRWTKEQREQRRFEAEFNRLRWQEKFNILLSIEKEIEPLRQKLIESCE